MGTYLNPGNKGFREILQSEYVDKTGLAALVNKTVGTTGKLTCISRPRRFGKSYAADQYLKIEELPSGRGIADVVYLPKPKSMLPALVVELKWNKSSEGAIRQVREKNYPAVLQGYGSEVVIVGTSYDAKKKEHSCVIERG